MLKIINSGCNGHMGRVITAIASGDSDAKIVAGVDISAAQNNDYPVYMSFSDVAEDADVIIDFSSPDILDEMLGFAKKRNIPLVLCTTGYSEQQIRTIEKASQEIPVFRSANMSVGINLLTELIKKACSVLGNDFDVEIVERHHRRKTDAPSGTALMLADAASQALPYSPEYVYERESVRRPRGAQEIGISAVRGGTIVGVHDVIFAGQDEVIELRHTAASRDVFAAGAIRAAKFIADKSPGLYNMSDCIA